MERRFQNERVSALQRLQPPCCLGFRGLTGSLGCIQTCDGKQLFRLPGKVGVRAGRLFTKAGQIFLCRIVDAAQGRNGPMAQAVAGVGIGLVRLVRHPALLKGGAERFGLGPGQAQQRAAVAGPPGPDTPCPVQPGAPGQPEQQGLGLVSSSMGRCNAVYPACQQLGEAGIAEFAGPVLPGMGRHSHSHICRAENCQRHPQPGTLSPNKGFVPVRSLAPQAVVDVAGRKGILKSFPQLQQHPQQRHTVGPARNGSAQVQSPARLRRRKQLLLPGKAFYSCDQF